MAQRRIVCTDQEPYYQPTTHAHIVSVGVASNGGTVADTKLSLAEVIAGIDQGEVFYTYGEQSQKVALVIKASCGHCGRQIIKTAPDHTHDNNLDYLRRCSWR